MTTNSPEPTGWAPHDGVVLLHTLTKGLIDLEEMTDLDAFAMPYPAEAQRALDRTVLTCLLRGADPPQSLAQLLDWCANRPLSDWPLDLPDDTVGPDDRLLDGDSARPTELCHEWAKRGPDTAGEHLDREVIHTALRICQEYGEEQSYSAFRELLVDRPVLTSAEAFEVAADLLMQPVRDLIGWIYQPVWQATCTTVPTRPAAGAALCSHQPVMGRGGVSGTAAAARGRRRSVAAVPGGDR